MIIEKRERHMAAAVGWHSGTHVRARRVDEVVLLASPNLTTTVLRAHAKIAHQQTSIERYKI